MVVLAAAESTAVQSRHGVDQTEPQPHARCAAAGITPIEALRDLGLVGIGNARTGIGDRDLNGSVGATSHRDDDVALRGRVFERVVNQVAERLREQHAIAADRGGTFTQQLQS